MCSLPAAVLGDRFKGMHAAFASTSAQASYIAAAVGMEVRQQLSAACCSSSQGGSAAQAPDGSSGGQAAEPAALIRPPAAGELAAAVVRELGGCRCRDTGWWAQRQVTCRCMGCWGWVEEG